MSRSSGLSSDAYRREMEQNMTEEERIVLAIFLFYRFRLLLEWPRLQRWPRKRTCNQE